MELVCSWCGAHTSLSAVCAYVCACVRMCVSGGGGEAAGCRAEVTTGHYCLHRSPSRAGPHNQRRQASSRDRLHTVSGDRRTSRNKHRATSDSYNDCVAHHNLLWLNFEACGSDYLTRCSQAEHRLLLTEKTFRFLLLNLTMYCHCGRHYLVTGFDATG